MGPSKHKQQSVDSDEEDEDDEPTLRPCTPQSRKAGKKCISLYDCRYDIGLLLDTFILSCCDLYYLILYCF